MYFSFSSQIYIPSLLPLSFLRFGLRFLSAVWFSGVFLEEHAVFLCCIASDCRLLDPIYQDASGPMWNGIEKPRNNSKEERVIAKVLNSIDQAMVSQTGSNLSHYMMMSQAFALGSKVRWGFSFWGVGSLKKHCRYIWEIVGNFKAHPYIKLFLFLQNEGLVHRLPICEDNTWIVLLLLLWILT